MLDSYFILYKDPDDYYGWHAETFFGPWRFWRGGRTSNGWSRSFAEQDREHAQRSYPWAEFCIVPTGNPRRSRS